MVHIKISQFIVAGAVAAAGLFCVGGVADAAPAPTTPDAACANGDPLVIPAEFSGSDETVSPPIACEVPSCAEGAPTVVTDDSGVQHQACVASAAEVPPLTAAKATLLPPVQPATTTSSAVLPKTGTGTVGLILAAVLVGVGSLASYLGRRKR